LRHKKRQLFYDDFMIIEQETMCVSDSKQIAAKVCSRQNSAIDALFSQQGEIEVGDETMRLARNSTRDNAIGREADIARARNHRFSVMMSKTRTLADRAHATGCYDEYGIFNGSCHRTARHAMMPCEVIRAIGHTQNFYARIR
jgi:hypothetical protein